MKLFTVFMILSVGQTALAQEFKVSNPKEFQFVHCTPSEAKAEAAVNHYIIDIRSMKKHKLYAQSAPKSTKAKDLKKLKLIDGNLEINTIDSVDVSWISKPNLIFKLNVIDNGGYAMDGTLEEQGKLINESCSDVSLERYN